ncbi:MAG: hypothetical protein FD153_1678 [Rhodospirillaceae bacterium]|nr:MAG: hypothetical protein FD153_1678 [Rhodospirillaceae bacterium]
MTQNRHPDEPVGCGNAGDPRSEQEDRIGALARHRFIFAPVMGLLTTVLMMVFVGYHAVFTLLLGGMVGIGVLLVLSSPRKSSSRKSIDHAAPPMM